MHGRKAQQSAFCTCQDNLMHRTTKEFRDSAGRYTPRSKGLQRATGEELMVDLSKINVCDAPGSKLQGLPGADVSCSKGKIRGCKDIIKLGTWNVRTMNQGKIDIVKAEMDRAGLGLIGISELKWTQPGHYKSGEYWVYYSSNNTQR